MANKTVHEVVTSAVQIGPDSLLSIKAIKNGGSIALIFQSKNGNASASLTITQVEELLDELRDAREFAQATEASEDA